MSDKHSPGPLRIQVSAEHFALYIEQKVAVDRWETIAVVLSNVTDRDTQRANAKRFVACWNVCEGINPEAVPALLEVCERLAAVREVAMSGVALVSSQGQAMDGYTELANYQQITEAVCAALDKARMDGPIVLENSVP